MNKHIRQRNFSTWTQSLKHPVTRAAHPLLCLFWATQWLMVLEQSKKAQENYRTRGIFRHASQLENAIMSRTSIPSCFCPNTWPNETIPQLLSASNIKSKIQAGPTRILKFWSDNVCTRHRSSLVQRTVRINGSNPPSHPFSQFN